MNVPAMLEELRQERQSIEMAIQSLERLARSGKPRRGRPPKWMQAPKRRGRPPKNPVQQEG